MAKKYSVNMENDEVVSVEVDGVVYTSPDQVPDPQDRAKVEQLMANSAEAGFGEDFDKEFEQEFAELERTSSKFPIIIFALFLTIAIIMLAIAAVSTVGTSLALSREKGAPGQVTDLVLQTYRDSSTQEIKQYYYPVVAFRLPDGSGQTAQLSEGSWPPAYQKGQQVTVLYDSQNPANVRIKSFSSTLLMWILPGITGTVGVVFLIVAFFVHGFLKPAPAEANVP